MADESMKKEIKTKYRNIALSGNSDRCCMPQECCGSADSSPLQSSVAIGYSNADLESLPNESILGVGCGAPLDFADLNEGETVVDLGSGAGIDVFLASKRMNKTGKVIGIDFTDEMLNKAKNAASQNGFTNVEFRKGDIEEKIPVDDNSVDVVISNCVINLTANKTKAFREIYRILKKNGVGRMIFSDLVTSKEINGDEINLDNWCSCIDGALTKENYLKSITDAGFKNIQMLKEQSYLNDSKRQISSVVIRALTGDE